MVEHDFYKLMQIEPFANKSEVKKRYYELALLYHPDKNPNAKHAEEYFKIVTQGYHILSHEESKMEYDTALQNFYSHTKKYPQQKESTIIEKIKFNRERKRQNIIQSFLNSEKILAYQYRILLGILVMFSGFIIVCKHWFINYLAYDSVYNIIGLFIYLIGCIFLVNSMYKKAAYKDAIQLQNTNYEKRLNALFMLLFVVVPVGFIYVLNGVGNYQLANFYSYTLVENLKTNGGNIFYEYIVEGEKIARVSEISIENGGDDLIHHMKVKYCKMNPNISELVFVK